MAEAAAVSRDADIAALRANVAAVDRERDTLQSELDVRERALADA